MIPDGSILMTTVVTSSFLISWLTIAAIATACRSTLRRTWMIGNGNGPDLEKPSRFSAMVRGTMNRSSTSMKPRGPTTFQPTLPVSVSVNAAYSETSHDSTQCASLPPGARARYQLSWCLMMKGTSSLKKQQAPLPTNGRSSMVLFEDALQRDVEDTMIHALHGKNLTLLCRCLCARHGAFNSCLFLSLCFPSASRLHFILPFIGCTRG